MLRPSNPAARRVALLVLAAMFLNAMVFGGLSAPVSRYQARIAWLAMLFMMALLLTADRAGRNASSTARGV